MNEFEHYKELGLTLEKYLRLKTFPIAIKIVYDRSELLEHYKRPLKDLKVKNFICQNFKISRTYGWTMAITEEDCTCKVARTIYRWDPITDDSLRFAAQFSTKLYSNNEEISLKWFEKLYMLEKKCKGLIISPLTRTKIIPDVIQVYCNPAQAMRLIQSYLYYEGGTMEFTAAGRGGSCQEGVIKTILTGKPQLVILGNGDRVWGGAEDDEIMFSIPKEKLELICNGLKATHDAGLRYPIPKYMNYEPGFQTKFKNVALKKAGSTIKKEDS